MGLLASSHSRSFPLAGGALGLPGHPSSSLQQHRAQREEGGCLEADFRPARASGREPPGEGGRVFLESTGPWQAQEPSLFSSCTVLVSFSLEILKTSMGS